MPRRIAVCWVRDWQIKTLYFLSYTFWHSPMLWSQFFVLFSSLALVMAMILYSIQCTGQFLCCIFWFILHALFVFVVISVAVCVCAGWNPAILRQHWVLWRPLGRSGAGQTRGEEQWICSRGSIFHLSKETRWDVAKVQPFTTQYNLYSLHKTQVVKSGVQWNLIWPQKITFFKCQ